MCAPQKFKDVIATSSCQIRITSCFANSPVRFHLLAIRACLFPLPESVVLPSASVHIHRRPTAAFACLILFRLRVSSPIAAFQPRTFLLDFLMRKLPVQIPLAISTPIIAQASLSLVQATLFKFSSAPMSIQSVITSCDLFP